MGSVDARASPPAVLLATMVPRRPRQVNVRVGSLHAPPPCGTYVVGHDGIYCEQASTLLLFHLALHSVSRRVGEFVGPRVSYIAALHRMGKLKAAATEPRNLPSPKRRRYM